MKHDSTGEFQQKNEKIVEASYYFHIIIIINKKSCHFEYCMDSLYVKYTKKVIYFLQFIGGSVRFSKIYKGGRRIGEVGNHCHS